MIFLMHAVEDAGFTSRLAESLTHLGHDPVQHELTASDPPLRDRLALAEADHPESCGVVVMSTPFFALTWNAADIEYAIRCTGWPGQMSLIPISHGLSMTALALHSSEAAKFALDSADGVRVVAERIDAFVRTARGLCGFCYEPIPKSSWTDGPTYSIYDCPNCGEWDFCGFIEGF